MNIVVTNDDGIRAPGIRVLAEAAQSMGTVTVIAPDKNWSASGHQKALGRPMRVEPFDFPGGILAWSCDCGPSDCSAFAALGFLDSPVDLVISGINPTPNVGLDITYSGTVTSALEAVVWGIKGIAFSIDPRGKKLKEIDFSAASKIVPYVIEQVMNHELPPHTILNVNMPGIPYEEIKGYRMTRQGETEFLDKLIRCVDPFGKPYYWFGGDPPTGKALADTDFGELSRDYVSITPLHLDLTAHSVIDQLKGWNWKKD